MANVTRGLSGVEPSALELMRSYAATEGEILRKVRIPNALPYFFTALKLATTLSLIGAIVAEYFGGQASVLGRMIVQSASALQVRHHVGRDPLAAVAGIAFYLIVAARRAGRDPMARVVARRRLRAHPPRIHAATHAAIPSGRRIRYRSAVRGSAARGGDGAADRAGA